MTDKQIESFIIENVNYFCSPEKQMLFHRTKEEIDRRDKNPDRDKRPSEGEDGGGFSIDGNGGHIEVKAIGNFLTRGNDNYEPTGSIPFEVFMLKNKKDIDKAIAEGRDPDFPGWLFCIMNHLDYMDRKEDAGYTNTTASAFDKLAYGLKDSKGNLFACIMFDDIPRLRIALQTILPPLHVDEVSRRMEWDIGNVVIPRRDDRYWSKYRRWNDNAGGMIDNTWYIPFRLISPLATVTMIDSDPEILPDYIAYGNQSITAEMQQNRLDTLKVLARYRDGSERRVFIDDIRNSDPRHAYINLTGIQLFDSTNPEHQKMKEICEKAKVLCTP